jgi:hypothetical protein
MADEKPDATQKLQHADLSARPETELSAAERAELKRRFENFVSHVRAAKLGAAPAGGKARRIRKWRP